MKTKELTWGIYIEFGHEKEFAACKKAKFATKKEGFRWCGDPELNKTGYTYPQRCVMRITEILERNPHYYD